MAKNSSKWKALSKKQRALQIAKYHEKRDATQTPAPAPGAARDAYLAEEVAPGLTRGDLIANTKAATTLKYGDATQQLHNQPQRINSWFSQYQAAIKGAQAQQAQNYANAAQGVQNLQGGLDTAAAKQWAGQQQAMAADATSRGATVDPKLADVAHNASNVRNALTGSYGAMLVGQGAAENKYLGERKVNAGVGRIGALRLNAQQQQQLAKEKGAFKQTYRDTAISDAASTALKNALTASQLGATTATTEHTKTETKKTVAELAFLHKYGRYPGTTDPNKSLTPAQKIDNARLKYFRQHGYFPRTGPAPKPKPTAKDGTTWATPSQQNAAKDTIDAAVGSAADLKRKGYSRSEAARLLVAGRPAQTVKTADGKTVHIPAIGQVGKDYASVALDVAYDGHISKRNVTALHNRHIKVKGLGYPTPADVAGKPIDVPLL